jgi:Fic family protein
LKTASYLVKSRNGVYYARFVIPPALRGADTGLCREVRISTLSKDPRDGVACARVLRVALDRLVITSKVFSRDELYKYLRDCMSTFRRPPKDAMSYQIQRPDGTIYTNSNSVAAFDENGVQIGIAFETASPFDTPGLMAELVAWVNDERDKAHLHPLLIIAVFVVVFLEIHPFQDGSGRLSRVLTTLLLIQTGYAYVPFSSLESVIELNKEAYYLALRQTQGSIRTDAPNWQPWLVFFLRSLAEQVRRLEKKVERERIVLAALPELSLQIVEFAREHGRITIGDAIKLTGVSRNTLKLHFRNLVERGHLNQQGSGRGVWYELK